MKRCPKCNRAFTTDTQKFCTHDGGLLIAADFGQETVRIEPAELDAPTKVISHELTSEITGPIDPYKTIVARPEETGAAEPRDTTHDLSPKTVPPPAQPPAPPPAASSGSIAQPPAQAPPPTPPQPPPPSAPLPSPQFAPPAQAQQVQPLGAGPPKKKSKLPLILGILAVLFILGIGVIAVAYIFLVRPRLIASRNIEQPTPSSRPVVVEPTPTASVTPNDSDTSSATPEEPPAYVPPPNAVAFVNSKDNLDGKLAEYYVDFSFYYPDNWWKDPKAGGAGARNFARVERRLPPDFSQEIFAVSWYTSTGSEEADKASYPRLVEERSSVFEKDYPEYRKVSEGETKIGPYTGYEFRFEALSRNTAKGDVKIWGRAVFLPPIDGTRNGVILLMLTTSLAPELKSVDDVGVKGELPMILDSFRFGKK